MTNPRARAFGTSIRCLAALAAMTSWTCSSFAAELTARELEICEALGPELAKRGLVFVGIDVIAGYLTEINVTSPTGIVAIDKFNGTDTPAIIWEAIEARVKARA